MRCRRNVVRRNDRGQFLVSPLAFCRVDNPRSWYHLLWAAIVLHCVARHFAWSLPDYYHERKFRTPLVCINMFYDVFPTKSLQRSTFTSASLHLQSHHKLRPQYPAETQWAPFHSGFLSKKTIFKNEFDRIWYSRTWISNPNLDRFFIICLWL